MNHFLFQEVQPLPILFQERNLEYLLRTPSKSNAWHHHEKLALIYEG